MKKIAGYCKDCLWFWGTLRIKDGDMGIRHQSMCNLRQGGTVPNGYCHAFSKKSGKKK